MYKHFKIGDHVRSFDFDTSGGQNRELTGPNASFTEGRVIDIVDQTGLPCYKILVDRRVYFGKECRVREGELHWPPVNGLHDNLKKWPSNSVELIETA